MTLDVKAVAPVVFTLGVPEVVEAGTEHVGQRGKGTDVAAKVAPVFRVVPVRLDHHRHRVPAHVGAQALLDLDIARATLFLVRLDGVHIAGIGRKRHVDAALAGVLQQLFQQVVGTLGAFGLDHGAQGIHPFAGFLLIRVHTGGAGGVLGYG
jgi:hypothetical protein